MYFLFLYFLSTVLIILSSVFLILYGFHEVNEPYTIPVRRSLCSLYIYYITYNALKQLMKNIKNLSWGPHTNSNDPKIESGNSAIVLDVYSKFHRNKLLFI